MPSLKPSHGDELPPFVLDHALIEPIGRQRTSGMSPSTFITIRAILADHHLTRLSVLKKKLQGTHGQLITDVEAGKSSVVINVVTDKLREAILFSIGALVQNNDF